MAQQQLADAASVLRVTVDDIEIGRKQRTAATLAKLAVTPEDLMTVEMSQAVAVAT